MADFLSPLDPASSKAVLEGIHRRDSTQEGRQQHEQRQQDQSKRLDRDLVCPICEEVLYQPVLTSCDHRFCLACLSIWLEQSPAKSCPLCRRQLCAAGHPHTRASSLFTVDAELEERAQAAVGPEAYNARALDALGPELGRKIESYRRKQERLASGSGVARAGLGLGALTAVATTWGAGVASYLGTFASAQAALASGGVGLLVGAHSVASVAFWTTALSADVLADAVFAGAIAGAGTSAFLWGMKFAAWFDGQGKYCILRGCPAPEEGGRGDLIKLLNLLDGDVTIRAFVARKRRRRGSVMDFVAESAGIAERRRSGWTLAAEGEPLAELRVGSRREAALELPRGAPRRLLLTVTVHGLVMDRDVGLCCAKRGQRFVVGEIDGPAGKVFRRWSEAHAEYRSVTSGSGASSSDGADGAGRTSVIGMVHEAVSRLFTEEEQRAPEAAEAGGAEEASPLSFLDGGVDGGAGAGDFGQDDEGLLSSLSRILGLDRSEADCQEAVTSSEEEEDDDDDDDEEGGSEDRDGAAAAAASTGPQPAPQWQRRRWDEKKPSSSRRSRPSACPGPRPSAVAGAHSGTVPGEQEEAWRNQEAFTDGSAACWSGRRSGRQVGAASALPGARCSAAHGARPGALPCARPSAATGARPSTVQLCARSSALFSQRAALTQTLPAAPRLWICRHGEKEHRLEGPSNWQLLLTPNGVVEVEAAARRLAAHRDCGPGAPPQRIVCSPFPRCVVTAGIYARVLSIPSICVEPGLCEVLTPDTGARGLPGPRPVWEDAELLEVLSASGAEGVGLDASYVPAVGREELRCVPFNDDRSEVLERVAILASRVRAGGFDGHLLVTHGSPAYRLVRALTGERSFAEPPMGSVIELVGCPGSGGSWGRVESFDCPGSHAARA